MKDHKVTPTSVTATSILDQSWVGYIAAILGIAAVTGICVLFRDHIDDRLPAQMFILMVLFIAVRWGTWPGRFTALVGVLCWDFFFLPPIYDLGPSNNTDWIGFASFLVVANVVGLLSSRLKERAVVAESLVEESSEEIRDLYNNAPCGYFSLDKDGVFVRVNDTFLNWMGYTREELIGKQITAISPPVTLRIYTRTFPELMEKGEVHNVEADLIRKDGTLMPGLFSGSAVRDKDGNFLRTRSVMQDITARKQQHNALFAAIVEFSDDAIFSKTLDGRILTWNKGAERMFGYTAEEMLQQSESCLVPSDRLDAWRSNLEKLARGETIVHYETVKVRKDGKPLDISLTISPIPDADGKIVGAASIAQDMTERKRAEAARRDSAERMHLATEATGVGIWEWNLVTNTIRWDAQMFRIYGVAPTKDSFVPYSAWSGAVAPEDLAQQEAILQDTVRRRDHSIREFRIRRAEDGEFRHIAAVETVRMDSQGQAEWVVGTNLDITERKRAENELRLLVSRRTALAQLGEQALRSAELGPFLDEAVAMAAKALDVEFGRVMELSPDRNALLLRSGVGWKAALVGQAMEDTGMASPSGFSLLSQVPVIVEDLRTETRFSASELLREHGLVSGMSVVIATSQGPYGVLCMYTRQRRTFTKDEVVFLQSVANVLSTTIERYRAAEELARRNRALRSLSSCNKAMIHATDETALLQELCGIIVEQAGHRFCWVGFAENDEEKTVRPLAKAGFDEGYLELTKLTWADTENGHAPTATCIRTGTIQSTPNIATDPKPGLWQPEALKRGYASMISLPLRKNAQTFGAITIYSEEVDAFGKEAVELLTELANDLSFGITALHTRAERERVEKEILALNQELEQRVASRTSQLYAANMAMKQALLREMETGFNIQQNLLLDPPPTNVSGLKVAALTIPSQRIDGDFYIFIRHSEDCLDVIVGDVMGKGIPAALLGAATKTHFLKALTDLTVVSKATRSPEPREIVMQAHSELVSHLIGLESFVTVVYARFDTKKRSLKLVDCGHTGVFHMHERTGLFEVLHGDNLPLGVRAGEQYEQITVPFEPGDLFFFFSDGVTEARNAAGELFGMERLQECIMIDAQAEPKVLIDAIRKAVFTFSGSSQMSDDLTSLAVRVEEKPVPVARAEIEIGSDLKDLRQVREFVRTFCGSLPGKPIEDDDIAALALAANEATSNIMKHAYQGRKDQWIQLEAEDFPSHLSIRLHHLGDPFNPSMAAAPPFDGSRDSGFGAYIILNSVDDVRYYRDDRGRSCVELIKTHTSHNKGPTK